MSEFQSSIIYIVGKYACMYGTRQAKGPRFKCHACHQHIFTCLAAKRKSGPHLRSNVEDKLNNKCVPSVIF